MQTIDELLIQYESTAGKILIDPSEKEYLKAVLQSIGEFAAVIGMQECFEKNFEAVVFCVHNSTLILDCLNPNGRYCSDVQKSVKLFVLIIALQKVSNRQSDCVHHNALDQEKIAELLDIQEIDGLIAQHLKRDRSIEASLYFFNNLLNTLTYKDDTSKYLDFRKEDFDVEEPLVTESALMAVLGTFQLFREMREKSPDLQISSAKKQFFKLYYLYYSDVYFCLSHEKFSNVLEGFFSQYGTDGRQFKFFYDFMQKLMGELKHTDLLDGKSFYRETLIHPFEMIDKLYDVPYNFYDRVQREKQDWAVNFGRYSRDLKALLYYAWDEADYAYILAKRFDDNEFTSNDVKKFTQDLFEIILDSYHQTSMLPKGSLLRYFVQKDTGDMHSTNESARSSIPFFNSFINPDSFGSMFDRMLEMAMSTNLIQNERILGWIQNGMLKTAATNMMQNFSTTVGGSVQSTISNQIPTIRFSTIAKGVLWFWKTFNHSHEVKDLAKQGKSNEIVDKFVGVVKDPAVNLVNKGLERVPYGAMINTSTVGQVMETLLGQIHNFVGTKSKAPEEPFMSGNSNVLGFASGTSGNSGSTAPPSGDSPEDAF